MINKSETVEVTLEEVINTFKRFRGKIKQVPPMVSAVSIGGKRLYKLARKGINVPRPAREVEIYKLDIINYEEGEYPRVSFGVACSKGTYVRTLCADIGDVLGWGAHQASLVRTRVGKFKLEDSINLDKLSELARKGEVKKVLLVTPVNGQEEKWKSSGV